MIAANRYRKRPIEIEARQWDGSTPSATDLITWILETGSASYRCGEHCCDGEYAISIRTLEGSMKASPGDWILRGVQGEFYPCRDDIFRLTYEPVEGPTQ